MDIQQILEEFGFVQNEDGDYEKDNWTLRLDNNHYFELYSDPEIDSRYYYGSLDNLDKYLNAI